MTGTISSVTNLYSMKRATHLTHLMAMVTLLTKYSEKKKLLLKKSGIKQWRRHAFKLLTKLSFVLRKHKRQKWRLRLKPKLRQKQISKQKSMSRLEKKNYQKWESKFNKKQRWEWKLRLMLWRLLDRELKLRPRLNRLLLRNLRNKIKHWLKLKPKMQHFKKQLRSNRLRSKLNQKQVNRRD